MNRHCAKRVRLSEVVTIHDGEDEGVRDIDMDISSLCIKFESDPDYDGFENVEMESYLSDSEDFKYYENLKIYEHGLKTGSATLQTIEDYQEIHSIPKDFEFRPRDILDILCQEFVTCPEQCICKISQKRARGPIKEIFDHKWHGGKLFLLCKHHSMRAYPEYLLPCQVNCVLRAQYARYLKAYQRPVQAKDKWTKDNETAIRNFLTPTMDAEQTRIQEEIPLCLTTVDWVAQSTNGKIRLTKDDIDDADVGFCPGPVLKTKEQEFFEVEKVMGSKLDAGEILYFVKWRGYPDAESTWEPRSSLQMSFDVVDQFQHEHGKPSVTKPCILSAEGLKIQKLQQRAAKVKL